MKNTPILCGSSAWRQCGACSHRWFHCVRACTDGRSEGSPESAEVTLQPPLGSRSRQDFQQVPWGKLLSCRLGKLKWNHCKIVIYEITSWRYCILLFAVYDVWASMCAQPRRLPWMLNFSWLLSPASALCSQGRLLLPPEHLSMITEDEPGEKGPWSEGWGHGAAEAGEQAGLWQGMPSASKGARGLCTACQHLESHWAADPRASLMERTHFVRTQENFAQFFIQFSVFFNFSEFVFIWRTLLVLCLV